MGRVPDLPSTFSARLGGAGDDSPASWLRFMLVCGATKYIQFEFLADEYLFNSEISPFAAAGTGIDDCTISLLVILLP